MSNVVLCTPEMKSHPSTVCRQYHDWDTPTIFLAGTIDLGNSRDWQSEVVNTLVEDNVSCILFNPRRVVFDQSEIINQIEWELDAIELSEIVLFNFEPDSKSPVTFLELGMLLGAYSHVIVRCPKSFYRYDNVRLTCARHGVTVVETLEEAVEQLKEVCRDV